MKNHLSQSVLLVFIVLGALLALNCFPLSQLKGLNLKNVDLLADVQQSPVAKSLVAVKPTVKQQLQNIPQEVTPKGVEEIEDYSQNHQLLKPFYEALSSAGNQPVRIAFYGDSFVEGDILLGDLRDTLQSIFGGRGVGYVPIASAVAGFRQTVQHHFSGFKNYTIVDDPRPKETIGFGGNTSISSTESKLTYEAVKFRYLNSFSNISLFYSNANTAELGYELNASDKKSESLTSGESLNKFSINSTGAHSISFDFQHAAGLKLYGVSFEDSKGIYVDNFSMRGNSGIGLSLINPDILSKYDSIAPHRLILLQYGLNVANATYTDYSWYVRSMLRTIEQVKKAFPNSSIVLVGVSDKAEKIDGGYATMRGINELIVAQREMAKKAGIGFYNLFEAMGGDSTMIKFANAKPSLANKDYTHLNFKGGRKVAQVFAKTLLHHYGQFKRSNPKPSSYSYTN